MDPAAIFCSAEVGEEWGSWEKKSIKGILQLPSSPSMPFSETLRQFPGAAVGGFS